MKHTRLVAGSAAKDNDVIAVVTAQSANSYKYQRDMSFVAVLPGQSTWQHCPLAMKGSKLTNVG